MKRALSLALVLLLALCACAPPADVPASPSAPAVEADQLAQAVLNSQPDPGGLMAMLGEERTSYLTAVCGLEEDWWIQAAAYAASGVDAREILILRLSGAADPQTVTDALEAHRRARTGDFFGYAPDQAALLERAVVTQRDGYAALLVCQDPETALTALEAVLEGEEPPTAPSVPPTPEPVPEPTPTPVPTPEPTLDISGFAPFDPPGEYDTVPYDTSAILAAWESGAEEGLSEKDAAILARCRALFAEHVTDGMTDFEKELALHDALIRFGDYDETVYDAPDGKGLPDNDNPYGLLVGGYGICLAYTSSFQLLMDLAGIECVTVVGAAYGSTSDHAWNMVRLEGEWYCVDPTWNDPIGGESVSPNRWDAVHHEYFNVTSDYMRETDHQWDYAAVPEADARRFYWDGTGRLPN